MNQNCNVTKKSVCVLGKPEGFVVSFCGLVAVFLSDVGLTITR